MTATASPRPRLPHGTTAAILDRIFPEPDPYLADPAGWVKDRLNERLWSKQQEIVESVIEHRYTAVPSCHDSGKSYTASRLMSWWIDAHANGEAFVVSTAPSQTQVETILWREVGRAHRKGHLKGRITYGMVPQWKLGAEIVGFGRRPQDLKSKEEAMAAFQGIHTRYVLIVIDEAGGVPKWLWDAVDTLATNESARVLAIGNPDDPASQFADVCKPGSGWNVIRISAWDTPNFTEEEVDERVSEELLSQLWVEERAARWGVTSPLYTSKVEGEFPDISDDTLLSPRSIRAAQSRELLSKGVGRLGVDVAREGAAETAMYLNRNGVIRLKRAYHKKDTMETAGHVTELLKPHNGGRKAVIDADGLGAGVYDRCRELRQPVTGFRGGMKAIDKERFTNRRAEAYWNFRDMLENGELDLPEPGEDDELIAQLGAIKWALDSRGRIKIESKDDMKSRGLPSPDRADAAVYSTVSPRAWPKDLTPGKGDTQLREKPKDMTSDLLTRAM